MSYSDAEHETSSEEPHIYPSIVLPKKKFMGRNFNRLETHSVLDLSQNNNHRSERSTIFQGNLSTSRNPKLKSSIINSTRSISNSKSEAFETNINKLKERIRSISNQIQDSNSITDIKDYSRSNNEALEENVSKAQESPVYLFSEPFQDSYIETHDDESTPLLQEDSGDKHLSEIYPLIDQLHEDILDSHTVKDETQTEDFRIQFPDDIKQETNMYSFTDNHNKPIIDDEHILGMKTFGDLAFEEREPIINSVTTELQLITEESPRWQTEASEEQLMWHTETDEERMISATNELELITEESTSWETEASEEQLRWHTETDEESLIWHAETSQEPLPCTSFDETESQDSSPPPKKNGQRRKRPPGSTKYDCFVCTKSYARKQELKRHVVVHTGETPYACSLCEKAYSRREELRRHQTTNHTNMRPYECSDCGKAFALKKHLASHQLVHSGEKVHTCGDCGRAFLRKYDLSLHLLTHSGEKIHQCKWCEKSFSQKGDLNRHLLIHTREKPFVCEICNKAFTRKGDLDKHITTHSSDRPFTCGTCGKAYARKDKFNHHLRSHELEKELEATKQSCNECSAAFLEDWELDNHMLIHVKDEKNPYACELCTLRFSTMERLLQHFLGHSAKDKPHVCNVCGTSFGSRAELKRHFLIHTGERPFVCEICKKAFSRKAILKDHRRTHGRVMVI